jgi:hypothetical protein
MLLLRKVAIAAGIGAATAIVLKAGPAIDAIEAGDLPSAGDAALVLLYAAVAGVLRALVGLLFAFVPTDALHGVNLAGKWANEPVVTTEQPPTKIDVSP